MTWASNGYNLGSYLDDNSTELYLAARYKPIQGVDISLSYTDAKHGNEFIYLRSDIDDIISQASLGDITWSSTTLACDVHVEIINNVYAFANVTYSDIKGYDLTTAIKPGEDRRTAQGYLDLFTPKYLQGKNTTLSFGLSFGF